MPERQDLLESIALTTADYRAGDLPRPTAQHVDRWVCQFGAEVQLPLLRELDHVLKQTYFSRAKVKCYFGRQITLAEITGNNPCDYWRSTNFLNIQQHGHSQAEILKLFGEALRTLCGLDINQCGADGGDFIYLDDVLFTGRRISTDLSSWLADAAPDQGKVLVLVLAAHRLGEWQIAQRLQDCAIAADKNIEFDFWAALHIENRKNYRATAEVLWPVAIPDDPALQAYMAEEQRFPFEPRPPGGALEHPIFSSEDGRQLLERELLLAGMRIRSFCQNPSRALRPLGFSPFGLGFGSLIVTYRNCPNNVPLALWWGDPEAGPNHPFSKWYPLLPRITYEQHLGPNDLEF